jgi:hypothetical protein
VASGLARTTAHAQRCASKLSPPLMLTSIVATWCHSDGGGDWCRCVSADMHEQMGSAPQGPAADAMYLRVSFPRGDIRPAALNTVVTGLWPSSVGLVAPCGCTEAGVRRACQPHAVGLAAGASAGYMKNLLQQWLQQWWHDIVGHLVCAHSWAMAIQRALPANWGVSAQHASCSGTVWSPHCTSVWYIGGP